MAEENANKETSSEFWKGETSDPNMDAVAKAVAEGVSKEDLGEETPVEESTPGPDSTEGKEPDETKAKSKHRFESHEKAEEGYRTLQSDADKAKARLKQLEEQVTNQEALAGTLKKLSDALAGVNDPEVQAAVAEAKKQIGMPVLDRTKVDHKTATEIEQLFTAQQEQINRLQALVEAKDLTTDVAELEKTYPFAPQIKEETQVLVGRFTSGELSADGFVAEAAKIGYTAGIAAAKNGAAAAARTGSETTATPSVVSDETGGEAEKSNEQLVAEAMVEALGERPSYIR